MGLLDDAIREHLELKRRRGADTGEVTRQEQEALGPARRTAEPPAPPGAEPQAPREPAEPAHFEPASAGFADDDEAWEDELRHPEPADEQPTLGVSRPTVEFDVQEPEPPPAPPPPARPSSSPFESYPTTSSRPPAPAPAPAQRDDALADHEPDIVPADEEPEGEDLLEETPEFLEETPEHDRLWFEQRPPRDFDFGN